MDENRMKYLEFIQNIITRMNNDSFQIKNWSLVMLAALVTVFATTGSWIPLAMAIVTTLLFCLFDAYYMYMEVLYRDMYNEVIKEDSALPLWELNLHCNKFNRSKSYWNVLFSKTICGIYIPMIVLLVILMISTLIGIITVNV